MQSPLILWANPSLAGKWLQHAPTDRSVFDFAFRTVFGALGDGQIIKNHIGAYLIFTTSPVSFRDPFSGPFWEPKSVIVRVIFWLRFLLDFWKLLEAF